MSATVAEFDRAVRLFEAISSPGILDAIGARIDMLQALARAAQSAGAQRVGFNAHDLSDLQTALDYTLFIKREVPAALLRTASQLGLETALPAWVKRTLGEAET